MVILLRLPAPHGRSPASTIQLLNPSAKACKVFPYTSKRAIPDSTNYSPCGQPARRKWWMWVPVGVEGFASLSPAAW